MWLLVGIWGSCFLWKRKQRNNTCGWQLKLSQKKTLLITETQLRPPATVVSSLLHPLMLDQIKMRPYYMSPSNFCSLVASSTYAISDENETLHPPATDVSSTSTFTRSEENETLPHACPQETVVSSTKSNEKEILLCPLEPPESTKSTEIPKIVLKKRIKNQELQ